MIDAPIGGTSSEAAIGKSVLMVGGEEADIARALPLFELLGDAVVCCRERQNLIQDEVSCRLTDFLIFEIQLYILTDGCFCKSLYLM